MTRNVSREDLAVEEVLNAAANLAADKASWNRGPLVDAVIRAYRELEAAQEEDATSSLRAGFGRGARFF